MNLSGQTVFVTGACGFIGSHLVEALVRRGAKTRALALYDARGSLGWIEDMPADIRASVEVISGDVRDSELMGRLIQKGDTVFHLAALIGIPYSYVAPRSYVETNITGTVNILEACRQKGAARMLMTSTSEVYGSALTVPISEAHPLQAQSPYAATKIAAEKMTESYIRSFELPASIVRPFNTFGPRQSPRAVIPTVLMQVMSEAEEFQIGDLDTTRDFNYVEDTVEGFIRLAECEAALGKTVNIGTGIEISIGKLLEKVQKIGGRTLRVKQDAQRIRPVASEVRRLCADASYLKQLTGWSPASRLDGGLTTTLAWMKKRGGAYEAGRYYV
jgi:NAD dependent epimerase/dehydratase